jgi:hypothetical protein
MLKMCTFFCAVNFIDIMYTLYEKVTLFSIKWTFICLVHLYFFTRTVTATITHLASEQMPTRAHTHM